MRRLVVAAVLVAAVSLVAAGCGSDDDNSGGTPAAEWADGLCSSLLTWKDSITSTVSGLQGGNLSADSLSGAVDDAKSATDDLTTSLSGLGAPDTESGQQAKDAVDTLSGQLQDDLQTIEDAVNDASGVSGILNALKVVTDTIKKASTQVNDTLSSFQDIDVKGDLEQAFEDAPSCQKLTGS